MAGLVDTDGGGRAVGSVARLRVDLEGRAVEREYREHRDAVLAMLAAQFPRLGDAEELYQDAWAELLELEQRGELVRHRRALLKTIAWRRAADTAKQRRRVVAVDPAGLVLENVADARAQPDEEAQRHLDGEALRLVVESLDEREAAAIKLKFDCQLSAKEVQDVLGVGEKLLELIVSTAYRKIADQLEVGEDGATAWTRRQRSLLLACELGIASTRQRRRAQRMLDRDPAFRGLLRAMRRGLDDVAAVLPVPIVADQHERFRRLVAGTGRLDELWAGARHAVERVAGRAVPDSNLVEAGVGGAGVTALAVKAVAVCVVVGGAAVVCLNGSSHLTNHPAKAAPVPRHQAARVVEPPRDHVTVVRSLPRTKTVKHTKAKTTHHATVASSSPKSSPAPSPAPRGSTEFGPGVLGSSSAPQQPAAAPADGGGEFTP
jgi:RNA polymerase sigma factor (sigma-70 family)